VGLSSKTLLSSFSELLSTFCLNLPPSPGIFLSVSEPFRFPPLFPHHWPHFIMAVNFKGIHPTELFQCLKPLHSFFFKGNPKINPSGSSPQYFSFFSTVKFLLDDVSGLTFMDIPPLFHLLNLLSLPFTQLDGVPGPPKSLPELLDPCLPGTVHPHSTLTQGLLRISD